MKSLENKVVLSWKIMENHSQISVRTLLTVFGTSITNLNEPSRALAASTIAWVRSQLHPFWAFVNKSNVG